MGTTPHRSLGVRHVPLTLICFAAMGGLLTPSARAALTLAPRFSDHMVLQRDRPVIVSGVAAPNGKVSISLGGKSATCTAGNDGQWKATLEPMKSGGPFKLQVNAGDESASVDDVLVGDVWLCSGQSNMQLPLLESHGGKEAVALAAKQKNLRLFLVPKTPAKQPQTTARGKWQMASETSAAPFSAVGMYFALALRSDPKLDDVPIGLIDNSFGGTAAEAWISPEVLNERFKPAALLDSIFGIKTSELFNGMVLPLVDTPLKGVLWYQGESNVARAGLYKRMLTTLIDEWRGRWGQPELPFLIVQLPNYSGNKGMETFTWIREAQEQVASSVKQCWLATTIDTPDGFDLHPKSKRMVGERLALLVRNHVYDEALVSSGPKFSAVTVEPDGKARVAFETAGSALSNRNGPGPLRGFMLAGPDGVYRYARAVIDGDVVVLQCDEIKNPQTVRYAWLADPDADLQNAAGLPAAPFRTDRLPTEPSVEVQRVPAVRRVAGGRYEAILSGAGVLTSLTIDGHQLLSNEPPVGLTVDGFFGPRNLYDVSERSPSEVDYSGEGVTLAYAFSNDAITVTLKNPSKDPATARLSLCSAAKVIAKPQSSGPPQLLVQRDGISLAIEGIDSHDDSANGTVAMVKVEPRAERQIHLRIAPSTAPAK